MLAAQWRLKAGIFQCDSFDIYSNVTGWELFKDHVDVAKELAPKVHNVHRPLFAPMVAGPPGWDESSPDDVGKKGAKHLANAPVFETMWQQVCADNNFRSFAFTAKVDIDTVLLPIRLSEFLYHRKPRAEYFFNTEADMYGNFLHGPLELLSVDAMARMCARSQECKDGISQYAYGEDFYLNECLKLLDVPAVKGMPLLYDMYTYGNWSQKTCKSLVADKMIKNKSEVFASYHPYKNFEDWIECYKQAGVGPQPLDYEEDAALAEASHRSEVAPRAFLRKSEETWTFDFVKALPGNGFVWPLLIFTGLLIMAMFGFRAWNRCDVEGTKISSAENRVFLNPETDAEQSDQYQ